MKTYLIEVQIFKDGKAEDVGGLKVTVNDSALEGDGVLDVGETNSQGIAEIQFDNTQLGDRDPKLYFTLINKAGKPLGSTKDKKVLENLKPNRTERLAQPERAIPIKDEHWQPTPYTLKILSYQYIPDTSDPQKQKEKKKMTNGKQNNTTNGDRSDDVPRTVVVDALPSLDLLAETGRRTAIGSDGDSLGGNFNSIINNAFSRALGSSLDTTDPKVFETSLARAFTAKEQRGRTVYEWIPQSYVATTDLGGKVTGAQASLYYLAQTVLDKVLKILNKLAPLDPAADKENSTAVRAIVRTELTELVNELGHPGGPRVQRVEQLFRRLLGAGHTGEGEGELGRLAQSLGLETNRINTIEEEQNYSNFLILRDYTTSLYNSWERYRSENRQNAYLGSNLVDLSRALAVVGESVREAYRIMDLYFLGPAERAAVSLNFLKKAGNSCEANNSPCERLQDHRYFVVPPYDDSDPVPKAYCAFDEEGRSWVFDKNQSKEKGPNLAEPLTVEDLLSWTLRFATEEGPQLAKEGGKIGIDEALEDTAFTLMVLVAAAAETSTGNSAFQRQGVKRSLRDLASQLYEVKELASKIKKPQPLEL